LGGRGGGGGGSGGRLPPPPPPPPAAHSISRRTAAPARQRAPPTSAPTPQRGAYLGRWRKVEGNAAMGVTPQLISRSRRAHAFKLDEVCNNARLLPNLVFKICRKERVLDFARGRCERTDGRGEGWTSTAQTRPPIRRHPGAGWCAAASAACAAAIWGQGSAAQRPPPPLRRTPTPTAIAAATASGTCTMFQRPTTPSQPPFFVSPHCHHASRCFDSRRRARRSVHHDAQPSCHRARPGHASRVKPPSARSRQEAQARE
jgi:hypothetical protein